jgi:carboxyl-terminal processing protease
LIPLFSFFKRTLLFITLLLALVTSGVGQQAPASISPVARKYLEQVLALMRMNALNATSIDWNRLRDEVFSRAENAVGTDDTYLAIAFALTQLKERHSWLQLPDTLPVARRQEISAEMTKIRGVSPENGGPSPFAPQKSMHGHIDRRGEGAYAHVIVPMCVGKFSEWEKNEPDFQQFADKLHGIVVELQAQKPDGWIIDLRGNGGGNMWPMLAGIGPVLGEGVVGTFLSANGKAESWFYKAGAAGTKSENGTAEISIRLQQAPFVLPGTPWAAVLLDRGTASSGEAVAISFAARPHARSFGEHTAGFSTSNEMYPLSDGAALFLCNGIETDRTGRRYPDGIDPDVKLPAPAARPAEENDAVIQAAIAWIAASSRASH